MNFETALVILLIISGYAIIYITYKNQRKRMKQRRIAVRALAEKHRLIYEERDLPSKGGWHTDTATRGSLFGIVPIGIIKAKSLKIFPEIKDLPLMKKGGHTGFDYLARGTYEGRDATFTEYQYTVSTGKSSHTYRFQVAAFKTERVLPAFQMYPEHLRHKLISAVGYQDIDFEHAPEFSKKYLLRSKEENRTRDLFQTRLLHFVSEQDNWHIEGDKNWLLVYKDEQVPADQLEVFWKQAVQIADMVD